MNTNVVNSSTPPTTFTATSRGLDALKGQDFLKLLIKELQSQDPLKPTDSNQMVQQMSQIRQMEMSSTLNDTLGTFGQQQKLGGATNMIGRYVTGTTTSGSGSGEGHPVEGIVVGVQFDTAGNALLELHTGELLSAKGVKSVAIVDPTTLQPVGGGTTTPPDTTTPPKDGSTSTVPDTTTPTSKAA